MNIKELNRLLGNVDIYLLDQILKGRIKKNNKILDVGCGEGRNAVYFIINNYKVFGIDKSEDSLRMLKYLAKSINPSYPVERFQLGDTTILPYKRHEFNAIISNTVLHFAENATQFRGWFSELHRVLKPGGFLFIRMATLLRMEDEVKPLENGKYLLPDGSVRFLLTRELLDEISMQFDYLEPFKTVVVDNLRSMCVLVLKKKDDELL